MHYVLDTSRKHIGMDDIVFHYCHISSDIETQYSNIKLLQN